MDLFTMLRHVDEPWYQLELRLSQHKYSDPLNDMVKVLNYLTSVFTACQVLMHVCMFAFVGQATFARASLEAQDAGLSLHLRLAWRHSVPEGQHLQTRPR